MNNLDKQYTSLLQDILDNGITKKDRTGTGTISVFGRQIRHKMSDGFPLLTTKKMPFKTIVTELLWFLRGDTNIKYLVDNNCHIWDGDCFANYQKEFKKLYYHTAQMSKEEFINRIKTDDEFAKKWGSLGPVYGKQWRSWNGNGSPLTKDYGGNVSSYLVKPIDQIQNLINELKTNPDSRRLMVNAWNVGELDQMVLPPCHYGFQVYTRELNQSELNILYNKRRGVGEVNTKYSIGTITAKDPSIPRRTISLMWNQRSVDTFLGLPFNIASYGLLLEIIANEVNMVPDELIGNLGDTHLYLNHIEQAKEQIGRELSLEERTEMLKDSSDFKRDFYDRNGKLIVEDKLILDKSNIPTRTREPYPLPTLRISSGPLDDIAHHEIMDFDILNYQSHPKIEAPLSN
jgi:thymidylate synthase